MDITRHRKLGKARLARTLAKQSQDNTNPIISDDEYTLDDGRVVKMAPDLKNMPEFDWDDPDQKKWAEGLLEKWRKKEPNLTSEELDRRTDALLKARAEERKKSQY